MTNVQKALLRPYLPAAGSDRALPFYDLFVKLLGGDKARDVLINQAALQPSQSVLDVGCGTGTLLVQLKKSFPDIHLVGLDPDPLALERAKAKTSRNRVSVQFDHGYADELPYHDSTYHRVLSSFMFHHLPAETRAKALREIRRVLKSGGSLHLVDFSQGSQSHGLLAHLFHGNKHLKDNSDQKIVSVMKEAGFENAHKLSEASLLLGIMRIAYFTARK